LKKKSKIYKKKDTPNSFKTTTKQFATPTLPHHSYPLPFIPLLLKITNEQIYKFLSPPSMQIGHDLLPKLHF
jgi:hypothetical protein